MDKFRYRDWTIEYNPKPIPIPIADYDFYHDDYDIDNNLNGWGASIRDCILQIDDIEDNG